MIDEAELDEMLKRVGGSRMFQRPRRDAVEGGTGIMGQPEYDGLGLEDIRAGAAAEQAGGTPMPKGTKVVFAEPELDVAAPVSAAARMPIVPKVVDVPSGPEQDPDRLAAAAARAQDRMARQRMALERGGRELVAGLTRTTPQAVTPQPTDAFERWAQLQRQKKQDSLRETEARNNAARTDAYLKTTEAAGPRADRKLSLEEQALKAREEAAKLKAEQDAERASFEHEKFDESKRHNRSTEGAQWTAAKRAGDKAERDEERLRLKTDALKPRQGWEPIEPGAPTFRDASQAKSFDDSVAAMGAIRNHRDHVLHELSALKKAKSVKEADIIVGRLNAQMGALASKLRAAEGLNNTDAANHAIETMLSLKNGTAVNWKNVVNEGRLPGIISAAIDSGEANLDTVAQSNNLRRAKAGPVSMKFPDGSVHPVDPSDMAEAKARGAVPNG